MDSTTLPAHFLALEAMRASLSPGSTCVPHVGFGVPPKRTWKRPKETAGATAEGEGERGRPARSVRRLAGRIFAGRAPPSRCALCHVRRLAGRIFAGRAPRVGARYATFGASGGAPLAAGEAPALPLRAPAPRALPFVRVGVSHPSFTSSPHPSPRLGESQMEKDFRPEIHSHKRLEVLRRLKMTTVFWLAVAGTWMRQSPLISERRSYLLKPVLLVLW